jgi:putative transposase
MVVRIAEKRMYLWRAIDQEGEILDLLVQSRRDKRATVRLICKLLCKQGFAPKLAFTDKLRSYGAAFQAMRLTCRHAQGLRITTGPKIRTRSCDDESKKCSGSIRPDPHNDFSAPTLPSTIPSTCNAISSSARP